MMTGMSYLIFPTMMCFVRYIWLMFYLFYFNFTVYLVLYTGYWFSVAIVAGLLRHQMLKFSAA